MRSCSSRSPREGEININGKPLVIDGHAWEGDDAPTFTCQDTPVTSPHVRLAPPTDPQAFTLSVNGREVARDVDSGSPD
jgi:hypothetical protein